MSDEPIKACVDRLLPMAMQGEAAALAGRERADNMLSPFASLAVSDALAAIDHPVHMALLYQKLWERGRTLRISFLSGEPEVHERIIAHAKAWLDYAELKFDFGDQAEAEIRIACEPGQGSWSYIGTDALAIDAAEATMNYGWLTPDTDDKKYRRVVLHEFGHALGAIHEHQNPDAGIPWDKEAVYDYYGGPPNYWSREEVDQNLFRRYSRTVTSTNGYDPHSIMHYPVPNQLTLGNFEVGWNTDLSGGDKSFIRHWYPRD